MPKNLKYGWIRDLPDHRDYKLEHLHLDNLPEKVDLRVSMPAVYDQGELGSCTANAIAGAIEHQFITQKLSIFVPSRLFIYFNERAMEGTIHSDSGAQIRDGIKSVITQGVCPETEWPYIENKFADTPTENCYQDARKNIVERYTSIGQNLPTLKSCLAQGYPIIFGASIYENFESDAVAKSGIVPMPGKHEQCLGGHAILIVGYNNDQHSFIVRNSWGSNWGINGYCYFPYNYIVNPDLASDFWTIKLVE
jgi:C1A family cysteine protease